MMRVVFVFCFLKKALKILVKCLKDYDGPEYL